MLWPIAMSQNLLANPWLTVYDARPAAGLRLFCLPFAGGGASVYRLWGRSLPPSVEVTAIQLPGRETRIRDPLVDRAEAMVARIADALATRFDRPYALYGHSMGALLSFEVIRELRRRGAPLPVHLFASARRAPHVPAKEENLHRLPDAQFVDGIRRRYNAIPDAVLAEKELMELFIPILRSDFALIETYAHRREDPVDVPISAFGGVDDRQATRQDLEPWAELTRGPFALRSFTGGHFFIQTHRDPVLRAVEEVLSARLR